MKNSERFVIYGLIALLGMFILAQSRPGAVADAPRPSDLGPADALILTGSGTAGNLTVKNSGGRISWGDQPTDRAISMGCARIEKIMGKFLGSEKYVSERKTLEEKLDSQKKELQARFDDFRKQYGKVEPGTADAEKAEEAYKSIRDASNKFREEAQSASEKLAAEQLERAYKDIVSAVDVVAERRHIDLVFRFVPTGEKFEGEDPEGPIVQVTTRPFLRFPESMDITADVLKELNLSE